MKTMKNKLIFQCLLLVLCAMPVLVLAQSKKQRYKVAVIDLMLLKRQKLGAIPLAKEVGADGLEIDMGGLGNRPTFDNKLLIDSTRKQFQAKAKEEGIVFSSVAMTGYYAQSFCQRDSFERSIGDCITTMNLLGVKTGFLPLGVQCDLVKNPALRTAVVERLKVVGKMAEAAHVVIGIETPLPAEEQVKLLKEIGSPAIKIYVNFADIIASGRDIHQELKLLGRKRICMIHCTNKDGVWLENDPAIDLYSIKKTLKKIRWRGWLVIERSRDAKEPSNVRKNFSANVKYVKAVFQ